ncbi:RNA-directed DNA polymerase from mobile element jockey-like [Brachionus plicatilis]|uniref:RNA-directed DNA polymerase from mobile element jockey-like n=1 Tax=Brachionus plicatilis TaxID=10195 RepID=A0A3M7RVP0_BRAPC|nr:RNA-directed DNA polymerase from mobile element jockey-like [Brachionus plicatilis]
MAKKTNMKNITFFNDLTINPFLLTPAVNVLAKNKRDLCHKNQASKWKIRSLVLEYKKCREDVKRICRSTIRYYESELASDKNNPKRLFAYINSKHGTKVEITSIIDGKG